ncbi:MAG: rRNA maturation RNase YbeY [Planctomycetales bacterium]|nr:rRNA maturation RNase YbeY [Planctomycetales bacterium]
MIEIAVNNRQRRLPVNASSLADAARRVLAEAGADPAQISIAVVDDPEMQRLNARYLDHDWPTDVLSFVLDDEDALEGEVIVSVDTAARVAPQFGWGCADELLLYVVHGSLHLVGYDDQTDDALAEMRAAEARHLAHWGLTPTYAARDDAAGQPGSVR